MWDNLWGNLLFSAWITAHIRYYNTEIWLLWIIDGKKCYIFIFEDKFFILTKKLFISFIFINTQLLEIVQHRTKTLYKILVIIYNYNWKCSVSGYGFAGAQPRLAKIAASLAIFRLLAVAPYSQTQSSDARNKKLGRL